MPVFSMQLGNIENQAPEAGIRSLANHVRRIQEELEYRLAHMDSTNITEIDGDVTDITLGGKPIVNILQDVSGNYSALVQTVNGVSSTVSMQGESISTLEQTASSIQSTVASQAGQISTLQQTASSLTSRVANTEGNISTLQQTANSLTSQISSLNGNVSTLQQTAKSLTASVADLEDATATMLMMDSKGVYIVDQAGNQVTISGGQIDAKYLEVDAANVSGTLGAGSLILDGLLELKYGRSIYGYVGATDVGQYEGAVLTGANQNNGFLATSGGARMTYSLENEIWVASSGCHSSSTIQVTSDRRLKTNISYELTDEERLFLLMKPCSFQMIKDKEGKKRWGFIAQDLIEAAENAGLDPDTLAVLANYEGMYSVGYGEITALNTHMIQKLMERVDRLEANA